LDPFDPIVQWLQRYFQNVQSSASPAASDATAVARRFPAQTAPQPTIGPRGVSGPQLPTPRGSAAELNPITRVTPQSVVGSLLNLTGIAPAAHAGYDVAQQLHDHNLAGAAGTLAAAAPMMIPGIGEEAAPVEDAMAARLASLPKTANPDVLKILDQMRASSKGTVLPRVAAIDVPKAQMMAKTYEGLPVNDAAARSAYDALNSEVAQQAKALKDAGYSFEFTNEDPYKGSAAMMQDVRDNKRLKVFKTPSDSFHPYMTPEQNDLFRGVHDLLAHASEGNQFGPVGEENAYRVHASTLSPEAQQALATETRGQNSWVNFGPNAHLPVTERPFAEQKAALWPAHLLGDYADMPSGPADVVKQLTGAPSVITPPSSGDVFDVSRLGTNIPPGVTTERPPVKYPTARTSTATIPDIARRFREVYTPNAKRALAENPQAAGWYDMTQLRDAMANESPNGAADFDQFMKFMGPTSSGTNVPTNLRHASYFSYLARNGQLDLDALKNGTLDLPTGYANRRQKGINAGIAKIMENGNLDPIAQPKTFRYSNQLAGNSWGGAALDMHVGRQVGKEGLLVDPKTGQYTVEGRGFPEPSYADTKRVGSSPQDNVYPLIEDPLIREASKMGLAPAQYQALGWTGGAMQTGVTDPRTLLEILNDRLRATAEKYGYKSPLEAFKAFARGETPLWAAVPAAAALPSAKKKDR